MIEMVIASALVMVALIALLQMITNGTKNIADNELRSIATAEAVYGVEREKGRQFSSLGLIYQTTPTVTEDLVKEGVDFSRVTQYQKVTTADAGVSDDYYVITVKVLWEDPPPVKAVTMSIYRVPQ